MSLNRSLITSVVVEMRPVREVAAAYCVPESWLFELLARYKAEATPPSSPGHGGPVPRQPRFQPRWWT